jgi:hypothetical protein
LLTALLDECTRAAKIYECGKTKAPGVTNEIQKQLTNDRSLIPGVIQKSHRLGLIT